MSRGAVTRRCIAHWGWPIWEPAFPATRDYTLAQGFNPAIELTRTQTIMEGAPFCDFRFRLSGSNPSVEAGQQETTAQADVGSTGSPLPGP